MKKQATKRLTKRSTILLCAAIIVLGQTGLVHITLAHPAIRPLAAPEPTLHLSNISATSVTISWRTATAVNGQVQYGTGTPDQIAEETGESETTSQTHLVTISNLTPDTTYNFDLIADGLVDDNGGAHYQFTTGATLLPNTPDTAYGRIYLADGTTPTAGTLVYIKLVDQDGNGAQSTELAVLTNADGEWGINLSSVRTSDLQSYFAYATGDQLVVEVVTVESCNSSAVINVGEHLPAPDIVLDCSGPNIQVDPLSLNVSASAGQTGTESLNIQNNGDADLNYSVATDSESWLTALPTAGIVAAGESDTIALTLDATNLTENIYTGVLTITHNAPGDNPLAIPVSMEVLPASQSGLLGSYYNYPSSLGKPPADPFTNGELIDQQIDPYVDYQWNYGPPPVAGVTSDYFAVRWTGYVHAPLDGNYRIRMLGDNGLKLWLDGALLVDCWEWCGSGGYANIDLTAEQWYSVTIEYWEERGAAHAHFLWIEPGQSSYGAVPSEHLSPDLPPSFTTFSKRLVPGWNLVSMPIYPTSTAITQVLKTVNDNYDLVYAYDAYNPDSPWQKYDPAVPPFANSLTVLDDAVGFWINMTVTDTLVVTGTASIRIGISLHSGWNLVGYPPSEALPVNTALESIAGQYSMVYAYNAVDIADPWKKYDPSAPPFSNDLSELIPGQGYWIKTTEECMWIVDNENIW